MAIQFLKAVSVAVPVKTSVPGGSSFGLPISLVVSCARAPKPIAKSSTAARRKPFFFIAFLLSLSRANRRRHLRQSLVYSSLARGLLHRERSEGGGGPRG